MQKSRKKSDLQGKKKILKITYFWHRIENGLKTKKNLKVIRTISTVGKNIPALRDINISCVCYIIIFKLSLIKIKP